VSIVVRFLQTYGHITVDVGIVPYASTYGRQTYVMTTSYDMQC
jgi:hypothetical protein